VIAARVPFLSLVPAADEAAAIRGAIDRVIAGGRFVLGPEVEGFEAEFAAASGAPHAVGVGNGTDAIALILRALGIGAGDEVITTPLSAAYTALAVMMTGARPVFADIDPVRLTIDPAAIERAIGPRTRAVLPVHLYGQAAEMDAIERLAARHGLAIVEDCCQAHLATAAGRPVGTIGAAGAFSFYPTKNLAALGDAGAVVTRDAGLADRVRRLRNGGQASRYRHETAGVNSRLDELQAAILRARLPALGRATARRRALAAAYRAALAGAPVDVPEECDAGHVYHLFVVRSRARNALQTGLAARGIETLVHYPVPIPRQPALAGTQPADCPVADRVCDEVVSLPLHPALADADVARVAAAVAGAR
jgi:dTDP-3-amino-3,4,6-trideoxy-alpha-D-glucose transaminase